MTFRFGIDQLLIDDARVQTLQTCRVGLVAHPASITSANQHSIDALIESGCNIVKAFGPQHGMRGDKQDNMIESEDYLDPVHQIPVISLYSEYRYPQDSMLADVDIIVFDLQDLGCRIYTYIATLYFFSEACAKLGIELWVLDRPNPAGRAIDGSYLEIGQESFVGCAPLPTQYGLTIGELAHWFDFIIAERGPNRVDLTVIPMSNYSMSGLGLGWPRDSRPWINPSPNASSVNMCRCFPGTVLLEGTTLSEGRGTTTPLEMIGAPGMNPKAWLKALSEQAPTWLDGVIIRECFFSPTFHKHVGELCTGLAFHTDYLDFQPAGFKPYRLIAGLLKVIRQQNPALDLWRNHDYEYELDRLPIDVINGGSYLRHWVDDPNSSFAEFDEMLQDAEHRWTQERAPFLIYQ